MSRESGTSGRASLVERHFQPKEDLVKAIEELGITRNAAVRGLYFTGNSSADMAVSWIMEHPDENLDGPIRPHELSVTEVEPTSGQPILVEEEGDTDNDDNVTSEDDMSDVEECKMVFVVNTELNMSLGKLAAQVGHATLAVYRQLISSRDANVRRHLLGWEAMGEKKIVLKGNSAKELEFLVDEARKMHLKASLIQDAGLTQIPAGSTTVLAIFGPIEEVDRLTGEHSLL